MNRKFPLFLAFLLAPAFQSPWAAAQTSAYRQANLVSNVPGIARHADPTLINPWGLAITPGQPFWTAVNGRGTAKAFDAAGFSELPGTIRIPPPAGDHAPSTPTGVISNPFVSFGDFKVADVPSRFLFATEDGTIAGWYVDANGNFPTSAVIAVDNSADQADYKGLAILAPQCCLEFLVATNFHSGEIESYTTLFDRLGPPGDFTDPTLPAHYAPFGIQVVGQQVFVTYALQDAQKHNPVTGAGNGIVDIFDLEGNFLRRFASHGLLNAPWGVVRASANFGSFSNDILIGNFGDGKINAFDPATGRFLGTLKNSAGKAIVNSSLWGLAFGAKGAGNPNALYFTAGGPQERFGLLGVIAANSTSLR